ncbi:hypothetical protein [Candidatus Contubernalis alkaliaceticus]|uniref:hypothetical protein n=1 Tax=Candidatus Contubernalis alkaliaceticus TaxID=338645 RepID=UPI001F4C392A|nr:hypothetical protein [Candidatus Contubernalis alkalaceticus]UNC91294.1 hypothetical protein HUE98_03840 [Candidatus Contubernalis alkalaceticus]
MILVEFQKGSNRVFNDIPPEINSSRWNQLCNIGLITNRIRLIHSGAMHYLDYSGLDQELKIRIVKANFSSCYENSSRLKFKRDPSTDQRKDIGLLMGTAIGVESILSSSDIIKPANLNKIRHINSSKIADFQVIGPGLNQITFEVKGRQNASIEMVRNSCVEQLATYPRPKYSFITKIKYNEQSACTCFIDDPEQDFTKSDERTSIVNALRYYSSCMNWAGFYQLAERLYYRSIEIEKEANQGYLAFNRKGLDSQLVRKIGVEIDIFKIINQDFGVKLRTFIPKSTQFDDRGMVITDSYRIGFFVTQRLIETLIEQDFQNILGFKEDEITYEEGNMSFDLRQDGTVLSIENFRV